MNVLLTAVLFALSLFLGVLASLEIGRRIGLARLARDPEGARAGTGAVDGAIYGLLGLLVAFTFSGAASRFEERRKLIGEEANAIGTAYLRLDLLPAEAQGPLKEKFRQYLDSRLAAYRKLPDVARRGRSSAARSRSRARSGGRRSPPCACPARRRPWPSCPRSTT